MRLFYLLGFVRELSPLVVIWVVYLTDYRHLTLTQVGVMEGLFWSVKLAAEVPSGAFADRFGRRQTFFAGLVLEALGVLLFAFAGGFLLLTVSYGVWAVGLAFRSGNEEAYLYDALAADERQSEFGDRFGLYSALSVAAVLLGGLSGGVLAEATNLQIAVVVCLAPYALMTPVLLLMQEPPRALAASRPQGYWGTVRDAVGAVRRDRALGLMLLLQVTFFAAQPAFFLLAQPFMNQHHVPFALFGVLMAPVHIAWAAGGLVSGRAMRRFGLRPLLTVAVAAGAGGLLLLAVVDHVVAFAGLAVVMGAAGIAFPASGAYVNDRTSSEVRATVLSIAPFGSALVVALVNPAVGVLAERSLQLAFGVMSAGVFVTAGACLIAWMAADAKPGLAAELAEP